MEPCLKVYLHPKTLRQQLLCFGHSQSVFLSLCQTALWYSLPGFMFSERGTGSDMRIMLYATHLMQCFSLQMHISLSLPLSNSARALELCHSCQNCTTFQGVRERYFGSHHWKILQEFQCVCWASGVWNQQRRTLLDSRPISECGWKTYHVFSFRVAWEGVFICRFVYLYEM